MEFSAVNRRRPSHERPLGLGAKKDGCFRRLMVKTQCQPAQCHAGWTSHAHPQGGVDKRFDKGRDPYSAANFSTFYSGINGASDNFQSNFGNHKIYRPSKHKV